MTGNREVWEAAFARDQHCRKASWAVIGLSEPDPAVVAHADQMLRAAKAMAFRKKSMSVRPASVPTSTDRTAR